MNRIIKITLRWFIILAVIAGLFSESWGSDQHLFSDVYLTNDLYRRQEQEIQNPTVVRARFVHVNFGLLQEADTFILNLFDDVSEAAVRDRVEKRSESRYTWFGGLDGIERSSVVLSIENGIMAGNITFQGKIFHIRSAGDGIHSIREIDQSAFPDPAPPIPVEISIDKQESQISAAPAPQSDDGSIIDIMVVYTDDAAAASSNILSEIQLAIDETNASFANSGINQRLRLVHTEEMNYAETGNIEADLNCVTSRTDACLDRIHSERDDYGADMVSFWVENGGAYCGIAWLMTTVSAGFESNAFSVVERECATGIYAFGHELGHNMGAHHDRYVTGNERGAYSYSHGYVYTPDRWRTIMAYNNQCSDQGFYCTIIQNWSNPDVDYDDVATGVPESSPNSADNRKTLNNTASTVANFRPSVVVSFADVPPDYWAESFIMIIFDAGITSGCSQTPLLYCPDEAVTRAEMAVFLERGMNGSSFVPPAAIGVFDDVTVDYWAADWIEGFYDDGITGGCGQNPLRYCPDSMVTRSQMAVFLLRSKYGSDYTPPPATGIFADVPATHWAVDWIEQLYNEGITGGCNQNPMRYCPENLVTRAEMSVFISRTFDL